MKGGKNMHRYIIYNKQCTLHKQYLILIVDFLVGQVGNCDLIVGDFPDLMLRSLVRFSLVEKISKGLIVDLHKAGSEGVLKIPTQEQSINKQTMMTA